MIFGPVLSLTAVQTFFRMPFEPALGFFNRMRLRDLVIVFDQFSERLEVRVKDAYLFFAEVQTRTTARARPKAHELPARTVAGRAKPSNQPICRGMD